MSNGDERNETSKIPNAINETEGLAIVLERIVAHFYNNYPDARKYIAESIEWYDDRQGKVWERPDEELPEIIKEEQARWAIDRLRSVWRGGNFPVDGAVFESMSEYTLSVLSMAVAEVAAMVQPSESRNGLLEGLRRKMILFTQDPDISEDLKVAARNQFDVIVGLVRRVLAEKKQP